MLKVKVAACILVIALVVLLTFGACADNNVTPPNQDENTPNETVEEVMPQFDYKTYNNTDFSNYSESGSVPSENLPNQGDNYGTADPYVFRFNGMYYLYATSESGSACVMGWKSSNMLHWEPCNGAGLAVGHVSDEPCLNNAYAPEVYYFNGKFYMYTSPAGNGHYVLSADSPEGPFTRVTNNIGMSIDGSVFIDDDEQMYFLNASGSGIEIHPMNSMSDISSNVTVLSNTKLGWTEGPMIIKRNGTYFLTYTGVHYLSDGYRVVYSTEQDGNSLTSANAFATGGETPLLLAIDGTYKGLGHSSTVLGPDMDSYYVVYHNMNLISNNGSWRSMNIDRLIFNGTQMSVDGSPESSVAANMPAFSTYGDVNLDNSTSKKLTKTQTGAVFTAEFNFIGDNVKCIVSYQNENNYAYAQADYVNHKITLNTVKNGVVKSVSEGTLVHDFDPEVIHTVRIAYADGKADVYFDNMRKISDADVTLSAGKIGYDGDKTYYTAYSNVARGYSDRVELKQSGAEIGAQTFLPQGEYEGLTSYKLSGSSKLTQYVSEYEKDVNYNGVNQLKLAEEGDFARYSTYFRSSGNYVMRLTFPVKYCGRKIGVQINLGEVKTVTLPQVYAEECDIVTASVAQLKVSKGANLVTIYGGSRDVEYISFSFSEVNGEALSDLNTEYNVGGSRSVKYFGEGVYADCEIEVQVKLNSVSVSNAGIILRADNYANSQFDDERSIQGYYIAFNKNEIYLNKYDYNYSQKRLIGVAHGKNTGEWMTLNVRIKVNTITVSIDGEVVWEYTDARSFATGKAGVYCEGASVSFKQAEVTIPR